MRAAAVELATRIAAHPRTAIEGTKCLLEHGSDAGLVRSLREGALFTAALSPADLPAGLREAMTAGRADSPAAMP